MSPWSRVLWTLAALVAFVAVGHWVRSQLPLRDALAAGPKLEYYLAHRDEYNVVFVGNSLVYRGLIPAVFDQRMAERGHAMRSFNLGGPGMRVVEVDQLVRYLLRTGEAPPHLFIGRVRNSARIFSWERKTWRAVAWHTPRNTLTALELTRDLREPTRARLRVAGRHLRLFGRWLTTFGGGPRILRNWRAAPFSEAREREFAASAGFQDLDGIDGRHARRRRNRFLSRQQRWVRSIAKNLERERSVARHDGGSLERLLKLGRRVDAAGGRSILLIGPSSARYARVDPAVGGGMPVFNFDRPNEFPQLFDPDLRFDETHLSLTGAGIYTRHVADAFADLLDREGPGSGEGGPGEGGPGDGEPGGEG